VAVVVLRTAYFRIRRRSKRQYCRTTPAGLAWTSLKPHLRDCAGRRCCNQGRTTYRCKLFALRPAQPPPGLCRVPEPRRCNGCPAGGRLPHLPEPPVRPG